MAEVVIIAKMAIITILAEAALRAPPRGGVVMRSWPLLLPTFGTGLKETVVHSCENKYKRSQHKILLNHLPSSERCKIHLISYHV